MANNLKSLLPNDTPEAKGFHAVASALEAELKKPRVVSERDPVGAQRAFEQRQASDYAPPEQRADNATKVLGPLPDYVTHAPDVSRSAAIAAHAVVVGYEQCAQTLEQLGRDYHEQAQTVIQTVIETARLIREKGAEAFREVELSSKVGTEVVGAINDLKARMNLAERAKVDAALAGMDPPINPATNVVTGEPSRRINFDTE
jgi:hypothetical protein